MRTSERPVGGVEDADEDKDEENGDDGAFDVELGVGDGFLEDGHVDEDAGHEHKHGQRVRAPEKGQRLVIVHNAFLRLPIVSRDAFEGVN